MGKNEQSSHPKTSDVNSNSDLNIKEAPVLCVNMAHYSVQLGELRNSASNMKPYIQTIYFFVNLKNDLMSINLGYNVLVK